MKRIRSVWLLVGLASAVLSIGGCPVPQLIDVLPGFGDGGGDQVDDDGASPPENEAPIANAGANQTVTAGESVVLDGAASRDGDNDRLVFVWRQIDGSPEVVLEDGFSSRPRFVAPIDIDSATVLTFQLTVADGHSIDLDEVTVRILPQ
jgi:hypothetical protein